MVRDDRNVRGYSPLAVSRAIALAADFAVDNVETGLTSKVLQVLPAGFEGEASDSHAMNGAARAWRSTLLWTVEVARAVVRATCELNDKAFTHEVGAV